MLHFRRFAIVGLMAATCCWSVADSSIAAKKKNVIRRLSFNKSARSVKLFDGIESGEFIARIAVKDEKTSTVYISNETDQPLTVELPDAVAGVHVLKQFQPFGNGNGNGNGLLNGLNNGPGQNNGNGGGNGQAVGGQLNQIGGNTGLNQQQGNNGFGNGNGFFSIPPEATVALSLDSVCLQHGKKNPTAAMKYALRPIESVVKNNAGLIKMLANFDPAQTNRNAVQAAAWHLANDMTWDELKSKPRKRLGRPTTRWFTNTDLTTAQQMVKTVAAGKNESRKSKVKTKANSFEKIVRR